MKYSIIIPTLNHCEDLLKPCLESIIKLTDLTDFEVLIVSNGSTDGTNDYVRGLGAPFKLLSFPEPMGYTRAINTGIAAAQGEFVILLNNDLIFLDWGKNTWVKLLEKPFESDPRCGLTGPARKYRGGVAWMLFFCVMIRRSLFWEIGFLDEAFNPGAGEDTDFCLKCWSRNWHCIQIPAEADCHALTVNFPIFHHGSVTVNEIPGWPGIVARNEKLLQKRYGMGEG